MMTCFVVDERIHSEAENGTFVARCFFVIVYAYRSLDVEVLCDGIQPLDLGIA